MDNYELRMKEWHQKASDGTDYFVKFIIEYLAFIGYLANFIYRGNLRDRDRINKLKKDDCIKRLYLDEIVNNPALKDEITKIIEELKRAPLGNASAGISNNTENNESTVTSTDEEEFPLEVNLSKHWDGTMNSLEDWEGLVELWYTIRNNLFHGTKLPSRKRDQFMVEHGYETLKELVTILHDNKNSIIASS